MIFGSLFAGIGGFDLGLERAGMKCAWQVEINPFCTKILAKHWPEVKRYEDIRTVGKHNLESVDLICGGFPCQPHSTAGKRAGSKDERDLWPEYARIIRELRPAWVLAENVSGLLSSETGRFFSGVLRDLAECGYDAEWQVFPAAAFGAPHRRERVFIVAYPFSQGQSVVPGQCATAWAYGGIKPVSGDWWDSEPPVGRVVNGVSRRVDRLRSLGNAVVPQVVEWIGRRILEAEG
jgi:DNA (cytosine-5)-methyltransferase 1